MWRKCITTLILSGIRDRVAWDGDYVYFRMGSTPGCNGPGYTGDILLGGSGGLFYNTGSSNPNYNGLTSITKYGFTITTNATAMAAGYSLLNLFDGQNYMNSYAYVTIDKDPSIRQIDIIFSIPFNQWELTQVGYWEGIFTDNTDYVSNISLILPNEADYVEVFNGPSSRNTLYSFFRSDSFDGGDSSKNRFILGLSTATERYWHFYTEIIFELRIPYTEYKAWKRQYHVPVKIAKKTINDKTIGTIVMKGNS